MTDDVLDKLTPNERLVACLHRLCCPDCGAGTLIIEYKPMCLLGQWGAVRSENIINQQWDDESFCQCTSCDWAGNAGQAVTAFEKLYMASGRVTSKPIPSKGETQ